MNVLVICQGPAYGDERSYNGLRLAGALAKRDGTDVKVAPRSAAAAPASTHEASPTTS